jgi:hypothetical protein
MGGINIGGAAKVTLAPGVYYFQGGGFTVGGSATVTGTGVMLYNAPARSTDQINISGAASLTLTAATTGTYAGITIFQARTANAQLVVSGSGAVNVTGTVYAAAALVNISGAAALDTFGTGLIAVAPPGQCLAGARCLRGRVSASAGHARGAAQRSAAAWTASV